jgi:hypothetical protein
MNRKLLEHDLIRCGLCLRREQTSFVDSNGRSGHVGAIKSYSLSTSSSTLNKHLKDDHNVVLSDVNDDACSTGRQWQFVPSYSRQ